MTRIHFTVPWPNDLDLAQIQEILRLKGENVVQEHCPAHDCWLFTILDTTRCPEWLLEYATTHAE